MFTETTKLSIGPRTFEALVPVSGVLDVPFDDWPASMQDDVYQAMDNASAAFELPLALRHVEYATDHDKTPEEPGYHYVWLVVSEIIARPLLER